MDVGYLGYVILLLVVTGCLNLFIDVKRYANAGLKKEKGVVRFLGWFNLSLGFLVFIGNWVLEMFS